MLSSELAGRQALKYVHCNLCGADDHRRLRSEHITGVGVLHLVRCQQCGLVYVTPRMVEQQIRRLYERDYFQTGDGARRGYRDYVADRKLLLETFRRRMGLIDRLTNSRGRLLDVGCAAGYFLQVSNAAGWEVYGVEPATCMADYARSYLDLDVFGGTLREAGFPSGNFDVVTMWDVLEHTVDPRAELLEVNRVLGPDGLFVLETQNIASWAPKLFRKKWIHYGNDLHLFHFTPTTIARALKETGFTRIDITTANAGKVCSLQFIADKLRHINQVIARLADSMVQRWSEMAQHEIYINMGDEMIVCARKGEGVT
jgi:2-polyprenyl-3-methyl-5-hydroxy-6-metoxy-1,4-benzoquinol methylase